LATAADAARLDHTRGAGGQGQHDVERSKTLAAHLLGVVSLAAHLLGVVPTLLGAKGRCN
jgi:hypothetical protein